MQKLIHRFFDALNRKGEIPVSKEDALNVMETMGEVFGQVKNKKLSFESVIPAKNPFLQWFFSERTRIKIHTSGIQLYPY